MTTATVETPPVTPETPAPDFTSQQIDLKTYREAKPDLTYAPREGAAPAGPEPAALVAEPVEAAEPVIPEPTAPVQERWTDPETGEVLDMRTRRAKRIKAIWGQLEDSKRENALLRSRSEQPREPAPAQATPAAEPPTRPKPTEEQVGTTYESYGAYVEDLADWKAEQRDASRARIDASTQAIAQQRDLHGAYLQAVPAARARYADFDAVTSRPLPVQLPIDHPLVRAILTSPIKTDLSYALSSRPEVYEYLARLPGDQQLIELGRFSAHVQASLTTAPAPAPTTPIAPLPAPMAPVGGTATPTTFNYATATLEQIRARRKANGGRY